MESRILTNRLKPCSTSLFPGAVVGLFVEWPVDDSVIVLNAGDVPLCGNWTSVMDWFAFRGPHQSQLQEKTQRTRGDDVSGKEKEGRAWAWYVNQPRRKWRKGRERCCGGCVWRSKMKKGVNNTFQPREQRNVVRRRGSTPADRKTTRGMGDPKATAGIGCRFRGEVVQKKEEGKRGNWMPVYIRVEGDNQKSGKVLIWSAGDCACDEIRDDKITFWWYDYKQLCESPPTDLCWLYVQEMSIDFDFSFYPTSFPEKCFYPITYSKEVSESVNESGRAL